MPNDTVLRVSLALKMKASDLSDHLTRHWCRNVMSSCGKEGNQPKELTLVRRQEVLSDEQVLSYVVAHNDILEWRNGVNDGAEKNSHQEGKVPENTSAPCDFDEYREPSVVEKISSPAIMKRNKNLAKGLNFFHIGERCRKLKYARRSWAVSNRESRLSMIRRIGRSTQASQSEIFLDIGFECIEKLLSLQNISRQLVLLLRDMNAHIEAHLQDGLLPIVHDLVDKTTEFSRPKHGRTADAKTRSFRWLYPLITRSFRGTEMPILMQGYVDVAEWFALWRNQRRAYACLCDGAKFFFFNSKEACEEYIFEQTLRPSIENFDNPAELAHRRCLKDNAPQSMIDLVHNQWKVRKGEVQSNANFLRRFAFALFDPHGKMKLIIDVKTQHDADQWINAIKRAVCEAEMLHWTSPILQTLPQPTNDIRTRFRESGRVQIPLRWVHWRVNSISGHEQANTATLRQALKDVQRDRVKINGVAYAGACGVEIVRAIFREIFRHSSDVSPLEALQFARLVLLSSSRTQGGGDILDTTRLLFPAANDAEEYFFCPIETNPIDIRLSQTVGKNLVVGIRMEMVYRVVRRVNTRTEEFSEDHEFFNQRGITVRGVYGRKLECSLQNWNQLEGTVTITRE